ncbi:MAG: hypothetical protein LBU68_03105 [Rickettsiales bacterium]|jgi:prolyl-tRNA synthetase|nr:hypothetical protein [Rickettsiales bacterium]
MRQSKLFTRTSKEAKETLGSRNAELLIKAGFVNQLMAGVYSYLPLGLRVLTKIENIIREEMNAIGANEILMPAISPREPWEKTGRWDGIDVLFKLKGAGDRDLALNPTHEEIVMPLASTIIKSYKDLPAAVYQIQTKFRNEVRAKSGLMRGREFRMKDMYSFHQTQTDLDTFYAAVETAYEKIFTRLGIGKQTLKTVASGGTFSKYSHEYQTITDYGEDTIYIDPKTNIAVNDEVINDQECLASYIPEYKIGDEKNYKKVKSIEVGNIFKVSPTYPQALDLKYTDENGKDQYPITGCYGMGPSRMMGAIAEVLSDDKGLVWPAEISPFSVHLVSLCYDDAETTQADTIYKTLINAGIDVLYDDRKDARAGEKLNDSDLIGITNRFIVSKKTLSDEKIEWTKRSNGEAILIDIKDAVKVLG